MPVPKDLMYYIDAAADSTTRARAVLIVIITISGLVSAAFWNSRLVSWQNSRLAMAQRAARYKVWDKGNRANLSAAKQMEFDDARAFAEARGLSDARDVLEYEAQLQKAQIDNVMTLRVPVFGFTLDINDLGILGGFAFTVSLMWFRFSLNRERDNLELVFREARQRSKLAEGYTLLAMRQVLTVPRLKGINERRFWKRLPALLFVLPLLTQLVVSIHDVTTFIRGGTISQLNTIILYATESLFLGSIGVLTYSCYHLGADIERRWDCAAEELGTS